MLKRTERSFDSAHRALPAGAEPEIEIDLRSLLGVLRRRWLYLAVTIAVSLAAAIVYIRMTPPSYTAVASLMVDTRRPALFQQGQEGAVDPVTDAALVESQVETLRSRQIAEAVIRAMNLMDDPEFGQGQPGLVQVVRGFLTSLLAASGTDETLEIGDERLRNALNAYMTNLSIRRVGMSYVIDIGFRSRDRRKAALIANEIAETYVRDQLAFRADVMRRASVWLEGRINELRERAGEADRVVQDFKIRNNVIDANGRLLDDQQLADLSTQLATARADTGQAKARLDRVDEITQSGRIDQSVTDALKNEVITKLRHQYNEAARKEAEWSDRYGANHNAAVNLRREMRATQQAIQEELKRIAQTYRSDYEIAKAREASLERSLEAQFQQAAATRQAQVRLRALESTAESYRALHDSFLQRYMQTVQQQSSPITEARVITTAMPPTNKSWPKATLILAAALGAGTFLGFGAALGREYLDRRVRTVSHIEHATGMRCVGVLPKLERNHHHLRLVTPDILEHDQSAEPRIFQPREPILAYAVRHPYSQFAEVIRSIKLASDLGNAGTGSRVLGVVSSLPDEGKSTVAANLALLMAQAGSRVLLIDADLRHPSLSKSLTPSAEVGLLHLLTRRAEFSDALWTNTQTGLQFLPVVAKEKIAHTSEVMASAAMSELLKTLRQVYHYVILDLPPIAPIIDAQAAAHLVDDFILVVEWGRTPVSVVRKAVESASSIQEKLIGTVLNKVDFKQYLNFETEASAYYSPKNWAKYGDQ